MMSQLSRVILCEDPACHKFCSTPKDEDWSKWYGITDYDLDDADNADNALDLEDESESPAMRSNTLPCPSASSPQMRARSHSHCLVSTGSEKSQSSRKMVEKRHLEVETEIMRAISLKRSLQRFGRIWWRTRMAEDLWKSAVPVNEFDVFISHSWLTKGGWKILALTVQSGKLCIVSCWLIALCLAAAFWMLGLFPLPFIRTAQVPGVFEEACPTGPWVFLFGIGGTVLGFFLSPYSCEKSEMCFIDRASISQMDQDLKERGIYGIGGFLKCSKELRILWSPPYLSRLWCIFELAAYRKANPFGKVRLAPLYIESTLLSFLVGGYVISLFFYAVSAALERRPSVIEALIAMAPGVFLFHGLRKNNGSKAKLLSDMENFDIDQVHCAEDFDKAYVLSGIDDWYGSTQAFTEYVQGPLRKEAEEMVSQARMLWSHCFIMATPPFCTGLTAFLSLWTCGAPSGVCLSYFIAKMLSQSTGFLPVTFRLAFFLCDRYAIPYGSHGCKAAIRNAMQSVVIYFCWLVPYLISDLATSIAYKSGVTTSLAVLMLAILSECLTFCPCRARQCSRKVPN